MLVSLWAAPTWWPETRETIWNLLWLCQRLSSLCWACKHSQRRFYTDMLAFQTSTLNTRWIDRIYVHDMLVSSHLYVTHWKIWNLNCSIFKTKHATEWKHARRHISKLSFYVMKTKMQVCLLLNLFCLCHLYSCRWSCSNVMKVAYSSPS